MIGSDPNARGKGADPWHFCPWNGRQQQADKDALKTSHEDNKVEKRGQDAYKQVSPDHMGTSLSRLPRTEFSSDGQTLQPDERALCSPACAAYSCCPRFQAAIHPQSGLFMKTRPLKMNYLLLFPRKPQF